MPSSAILHAAYFAVGAIIGGAAVVATTGSRRRETYPSFAQPSSLLQPAIVELGPDGATRIDAATGKLTSLAVSTAVLKYGNPGPVSDTLVRKAYVAAYDRRLRHPAWTAEHLTLSSLGKSYMETSSSSETGDRSKSIFKEDESLPAMFRAKLADYFRSGYDRGHMVPAADAKISQEAMDETFLLSNIAPQVGAGFNRHYWAYLEDWCRRLTGSFADVYVFTVPLYLPRKDADGKSRVIYEVIGDPPSISVPTHFAKVVLASRPSSSSTPNIHEVSTGAFVLPNAIIPDDAPLEGLVVPVEAVERAAGLTLFSDAVKMGSKHICQTTKCEVIVRRFDDAQKRSREKKAIAPPK